MDAFKKQYRCGPGGYKCPCCGPNNPKERARARRLSRRRLNSATKKEIDKILS